MPHSYGYRARTRDLFSRAFRKKGRIGTSVYLTTFKIGDLVDIKADGGVQRGMPHKYYHGKTGIVFNVTQRAVGVIVNKQVGNRIIAKRIHVRIEHVKHSHSRDDFLRRVKENEAKKLEAKKSGKKVEGLKRQNAQPRPGALVKTAKTEIVTLTPVPFVFVA